MTYIIKTDTKVTHNLHNRHKSTSKLIHNCHKKYEKRCRKGGVFYRQERVTTYGKKFKIHKFRTMVANADQIGSAVTVSGDNRITPTGAFLRKYRLDELPQVFDVLSGNMSFVGTRPEVTKYVKKYTKEMRATLLLPAGITSEASIRYKDEAELLDAADDVDRVYVEEVLPGKMKYNLQSIKKFSFLGEIVTMFERQSSFNGCKTRCIRMDKRILLFCTNF